MTMVFEGIAVAASMDINALTDRTNAVMMIVTKMKIRSSSFKSVI